MALEPLWALAIVEQLEAAWACSRWLLRRGATVAIGALLAAKLSGLVLGIGPDARTGNPMLSGRAQRDASAFLERVGAKGAAVVTTTYNHAGVLEAWTDGRLSPIHAWFVLRGDDAERLEATWRSVLRTHVPEWVLLTDGENIFEAPFTHRAAIAETLQRALSSQGGRIIEEQRFLTEAGLPGWRLVRLQLRADLPTPRGATPSAEAPR
jgi:hypothetical protein